MLQFFRSLQISNFLEVIFYQKNHFVSSYLVSLTAFVLKLCMINNFVQIDKTNMSNLIEIIMFHCISWYWNTFLCVLFVQI